MLAIAQADHDSLCALALGKEWVKEWAGKGCVKEWVGV